LRFEIGVLSTKAALSTFRLPGGTFPALNNFNISDRSNRLSHQKGYEYA